MVSIFDGCDDSCGWVAAIVSALAYGSFGVPIKETRNIDVHPLVFQSYKTCIMFSCSWFVLWMGVAPAWTPWGLLSGLLWVAGGTGGIYAIRMAGLAIAVGTWASVMICVNFVWGILVFREPVSSLWATAGAFLLLALGLVGMSHFSAPKTQGRNTLLNDDNNSTSSDEEIRSPMMNNPGHESDIESTIENEDQDQKRTGTGEENDTSFSLMVDEVSSDTVVLCGITMTKRVAGFYGAIFNGLMTGSSLIPLHYAKQEGFGGANYMISFASGAFIANCLLWVLFFSFNYVKQLQFEVSGPRLIHAYESMPIWHFRQLWLPGLIAGILLSIAMFGSILAITYLGQGIGNSVVQSKILVSGLWGILWYKEIKGCSIIAKWFLSASLAVSGIMLLSHERMSATGGGHRDL